MKKTTAILGFLLILGVVGTLLVVLTRDQSGGEIQYTNVYILSDQSNTTIGNTQSISSLDEIKFDSDRANSVWIFDDLFLDYSKQSKLLEKGFSIVFFGKESDNLEIIYNGVQKYFASYYYMDANGQLLNGSIYSALPLRNSLHFVDYLLCNLPTVSNSSNKLKTSHMVSIITELGIYSEVIEAFSAYRDGEYIANETKEISFFPNNSSVSSLRFYNHHPKGLNQMLWGYTGKSDYQNFVDYPTGNPDTRDVLTKNLTFSNPISIELEYIIKDHSQPAVFYDSREVELIGDRRKIKFTTINYVY